MQPCRFCGRIIPVAKPYDPTEDWICSECDKEWFHVRRINEEDLQKAIQSSLDQHIRIEKAGGQKRMSVKNGVWHDAMMDPPGAEHVNKTVLVVKELKSGTRILGFGFFDCFCVGSMIWGGTWRTVSKPGKVLYWMPLPAMPEE